MFLIYEVNGTNSFVIYFFMNEGTFHDILLGGEEMKKVISIGEALIDFIPHEKGVALKDVSNFLRVAGGAPLNVAAAVSKLGGNLKCSLNWV